jgi:hypothetical protein
LDALKVLKLPDQATMNKLWDGGTRELRSSLGGGSVN